MRGHKLPLLRLHPGRNPALVVGFPDGYPAYIPAGWTDHLHPRAGLTTPLPVPLLDGEALLEVVRALAASRSRGPDLPPQRAAPTAPPRSPARDRSQAATQEIASPQDNVT